MTRTVGTADEVLAAFIEGRAMHTTAAGVPSGRRVWSTSSIDTLTVPEVEPRDVRATHELRSYNTEVAYRFVDRATKGGADHVSVQFAITSRKYSVTTSKLLGRLAAGLWLSGYRPVLRERLDSDEVGLWPGIHGTVIARTRVPGRHGGYGIPWHPTGYDETVFEVWAHENVR